MLMTILKLYPLICVHRFIPRVRGARIRVGLGRVRVRVRADESVAANRWIS